VFGSYRAGSSSRLRSDVATIRGMSDVPYKFGWAWNLKTVIGTVLLVTSIVVFVGSFERVRAGLHPTNIYTLQNGIVFLIAGSTLVVWGSVKRK